MAQQNGWPNPKKFVPENVLDDFSYLGPPVEGGETKSGPDYPEGADTLPTHSFADLAGRDIPARVWVIANMIPSGCVTSLYGIGGEGKTLISMQMAEAVSKGEQFMGQDVSCGSVLMMLNEDDTDEVGRRVQRLGANAPDVHVIDFHAVTDPCLMRFTRTG